MGKHFCFYSRDTSWECGYQEVSAKYSDVRMSGGGGITRNVVVPTPHEVMFLEALEV